MINSLLGITESFRAPDKLMEIIFSSEFHDLLGKLPEKQGDIFLDYFQNEQADRKGLKQDYTPNSIGKLIAELIGPSEVVADICAGTGSLITNFLDTHPEVQFVHCEEYSSRVIPFLLCNLAIRNISGQVIHGNSLTGEVLAVYQLVSSEQYSTVVLVDKSDDVQADAVIMNPPYSLPWEPRVDERFENYGLAPKSKSDYAFVLHGFSLLKSTGRLIAILPHGVLFRGASEGDIRQKLLERHEIHSIIGLPEKLFQQTTIPTVLLTLTKQENEKLLVMDASKECTKGKNINYLNAENIPVVVKLNRAVDKLASVVSYADIVDNDYNLNIPRYVDTFEPEPTVDIDQVIKDMYAIQDELVAVTADLSEQMNELGVHELSKAIVDLCHLSNLQFGGNRE